MPSDNNKYLQLVAPGVRALQPYLPGKPVEELERELGIRNVITLASNENPFGPGPRALAAANAWREKTASWAGVKKTRATRSSTSFEPLPSVMQPGSTRCRCPSAAASCQQLPSG